MLAAGNGVWSPWVWRPVSLVLRLICGFMAVARCSDVRPFFEDHPGSEKENERHNWPKARKFRTFNSFLIAFFACKDPGTFSSVLFVPLSKNVLELGVRFEDLEGRTVR